MTRVTGRDWSRNPGTLPWLGIPAPGRPRVDVPHPALGSRGVVHLCLPLEQAVRRGDSRWVAVALVEPLSMQAALGRVVLPELCPAGLLAAGVSPQASTCRCSCHSKAWQVHLCTLLLLIFLLSWLWLRDPWTSNLEDSLLAVILSLPS